MKYYVLQLHISQDDQIDEYMAIDLITETFVDDKWIRIDDYKIYEAQLTITKDVTPTDIDTEPAEPTTQPDTDELDDIPF
jgi:hypothetical protein